SAWFRTAFQAKDRLSTSSLPITEAHDVGRHQALLVSLIGDQEVAVAMEGEALRLVVVRCWQRQYMQQLLTVYREQTIAGREHIEMPSYRMDRCCTGAETNAALGQRWIVACEGIG